MNRGKKISFWTLVGAVSVLTLALAAPVFAQPKVKLSAPSYSRSAEKVKPARRGDRLPVKARTRRCVSARYYDSRRLEFYGRMSALNFTPTEAESMQMRFDVYRKLNEHRRYRRLRADGLGRWLGNTDPDATVYVRKIALEEVETAARYKAKVSYRWRGSDGKVKRRTKRMSKVCKQRRSLPRLYVSNVQRQPIPASPFYNYVVSVSNRGASEAVNVPVSVRINGASESYGLVGSIGPRQEVDVAIQAATCTPGSKIVVDPKRKVRQRGRSRPSVDLVC